MLSKKVFNEIGHTCVTAFEIRYQIVSLLTDTILCIICKPILFRTRSQLDHIDKLSQELNDHQRVFKMPLTKFEVLTILKVEFENLEEIYRVSILWDCLGHGALKLKEMEPFIGPSSKLLWLWQKYAAHAWQYSVHVWLLSLSGGFLPFCYRTPYLGPEHFLL